ncbi:hypothetical protein VspSw1_66 [Vibrio phage VspSw_1]|uniref:Uncharacterized protein n=1 Tax=Vibrio phage VspSw_1 TaxID=2484249 RepID=A0A411BKP7_9CAUD|nr:hypothetical protein HOV08_gp066 [Vibrio phage VspSw_1]QAY02139.1 hypothetical protein VspSw1_66 [Vibrio phage VspSw_1]
MNWKTVVINAAIPILLTLSVNWVLEQGSADKALELKYSELASKVQVLEDAAKGTKIDIKTYSLEINSLRERMLKVEGDINRLKLDVNAAPNIHRIRQDIESIKEDIDVLTVGRGNSTALLSSIRLQLSGIEGKLSIIEQEVFK